MITSVLEIEFFFLGFPEEQFHRSDSDDDGKQIINNSHERRKQKSNDCTMYNLYKTELEIEMWKIVSLSKNQRVVCMCLCMKWNLIRKLLPNHKYFSTTSFVIFWAVTVNFRIAFFSPTFFHLHFHNLHMCGEEERVACASNNYMLQGKIVMIIIMKCTWAIE